MPNLIKIAVLLLSDRCPKRLCMAVLFPESTLADCIPPFLLLWGPARIIPLHPEPLAASLCCLWCSFDGQALALAPDSQVSQQFGGRCCHKSSATNLHWADFCAPATLFCFSYITGVFAHMPSPQNSPRVHWARWCKPSLEKRTRAPCHVSRRL